MKYCAQNFIIPAIIFIIFLGVFMKAFLLLLITLTAFSFAVETPTAQEAKKVLDFYYNGSGVVLSEMVICEKVVGNQPVNPVTNNTLVKGKSYMVWMSYIVPQNSKGEAILIQFNKSGVTRSLKNASVSGSFRYRTWKGFTPPSAGSWEVVISHEKGDELVPLVTKAVTVQ